MNADVASRTATQHGLVLREEFGWLKSKFPSLWTNSYFVATVGGAPLSVIKRYVDTQKDR